MGLSQKAIDEFKAIYKEKYDKDLSDYEASESANNLMNFFRVLYDCAIEDAKRKRRLKKEPGGFPVDGNYNCLICGCSINASNGWYDWYGQTCLFCRDAIRNGIIPAFVCREHDSYYSTWQLKDKFKIHSATARKMIREGKLKARIVPGVDGKPYEYIFLKKENPRFISRHSPERKSYDRHREKEKSGLILVPAALLKYNLIGR